MDDKFKIAFNELSLENKRNEISNELMFIGELIKRIEVSLGINPSNININNYDSNTHNKLSESEMLAVLYEDIYNIQKEIITIAGLINK